RADREMQIQQQQHNEAVGLEREKLMIQKGDSDVLRATAMINQLKSEREYQYMPQEEQRQWMNSQSQYVRALHDAGMEVSFTTPDTHEALQATVEEYGQPDAKGKSELLTNYMPVHDRVNDQVLYFKRAEPFQRYPKDEPPITLPNGTKIETANQPISIVDAKFHTKLT